MSSLGGLNFVNDLLRGSVKPLDIFLSHDSLIDIYSRKMKAGVFRKACTGIFIAALVLIATNRKQPQRPSAGVQPQQDPGVPSGETVSERERQNDTG